LAAPLADLARDGLAQQISIGPLSQSEARRLLRSLLVEQAEAELMPHTDLVQTPRAPVDDLARRTGGVPYFLISCAQESLQGLQPEREGSQNASPLPWDVAQSILARASALGGATLEVLRAVAVIGRVASHK